MSMSSNNNNNSHNKSRSRTNVLNLITLFWFGMDAFTHLTIELGYCWLALTTTAEKSDSFLGFIWREYGRADKRWAVRDANIISVEVMTVFMGILCLFQIYGIIRKASWRWVLQIVICVCELYGGWMTFAPEWFSGNANLDGSSFVLLYIYLVFMNGLWVLVPAILLWDAVAVVVDACDVHKKTDLVLPPSGPSSFWFYFLAGSLVVYSVLVPAVLFSAEGVPVKL